MVGIHTLKKLRLNLYREYYSHLPIQRNKILFWSNSFKQYGCSPKYITEYILKNYPNEFELVWVFENGVSIPEDLDKRIKVVYYYSLEYLRELHTAKFIICNMRTGKAYYWKKRKEQIYIQTWHSSLRLKKIEKDAAEKFTSEYIDSCKEDSKKIDVLLSGCKFSTEIFKRAFWYDGTIMECGTPRCDVLLNNTDSIKKKVYQYYNISRDSKLLLYAPTFRSNKPSDFLCMDFKHLNLVLGAEWVVGARLHPNVLATTVPEGAVSMSKYSDMQELLAATDILITDFSSCMFDIAIARKKCILYIPDLKEYLENERGLYFNIKELPFPIAENMEELEEILKSFDWKIYFEKLDAFMRKIGSYEDGHATERICEFITKNISVNNKKTISVNLKK